MKRYVIWIFSKQSERGGFLLQIAPTLETAPNLKLALHLTLREAMSIRGQCTSPDLEAVIMTAHQ